ncbi:putative sugarkinase [Leifsonia rubra CMS 76R]|uniref:Glucokinase n=1 Tax=Rhodoglobus vestalii TaxID=193384 RepID=A0A8H2K3B1_9MICO|nr:ROK family protein [Rhodoglobus vestalii]EPR77237.1 putative sugarkinase [Leifsonia rubra CMS 76R]TQO18988.1 glucokinase [Rhodoglobus vestalii]
MTTTTSNRYALAIDLGGTKVEAALVDPNGAIFPPSRFRAPTGRASSSDQLAESVRTVIRKSTAALPDDAELLGAGIGSAGPISLSRGEVSPLNLPAWRDFGLRAVVEEELPGLSVSLRGDGNCIALAEHWIGAAQGVKFFMGMVVSTGVGGGLILDDRLIDGPTGNGGHFGHVEVGGEDTVCGCGGTGCVEAVASGPKTVEWAQAHGWTGTTGEELAAHYADGNEIAVQAVRRSARAVGHAIASATALVDLELVAIGGGFSHVSADYIALVAEAITDRAAFPFITKVRVVASALSHDGPLIGAAALVHHPERLSEAARA